jgi:hypothetical protein
VEQAGPRVIVAKNIQRVLAKVKTAAAYLGHAFILEGFALSELEFVTLHVPIESLESVDDGNSLFFNESAFSISH